MMLWLTMLLFLLLLAAGPWWPYGRGWSFAPAGLTLAGLLLWLLVVWSGAAPLRWPWDAGAANARGDLTSAASGRAQASM